MKILICLTVLLGFCQCVYGPLFWPLPAKYTSSNQTYSVDPCKVTYKVATSPVYLQQNIDFYLTSVWKCGSKSSQLTSAPTLKVTLIITVTNTSLIPPFSGFENYTLTANTQGSWQLKASYYPGFLRGFETYSQLFKWNVDTGYEVEGLPVTVTDGPEFPWRGIMIDTSRHYLPVSIIKTTLDGCLFNKVNVMHWHITDEDSFPIEIQSHPELTQYGSFNNKTYSKQNVLDIVQYALRRGVRVIPEIDSPAHTLAWGRSPDLQNITIECYDAFNGQFDPTQDLTYKVIEDVMREINELFIDPVVHFGGDEVETSCWDKRPSIKDWMAKNNIKSYDALQVYYRQKQKAIWKTISTKAVSYWANEQINLPTESDDYIQWWGSSANIRQLENRTNNIVLSNYDLTYLDIGYGGRGGMGYGTTIETWKTMYKLQPNIPNIKGKILGGEACLWSQTNNQYTQMQKLWLRASSTTERLWNSKVSTASWRGVVGRLSEHGRRMRQRGLAFSPMTVELCERDPTYCFA